MKTLIFGFVLFFIFACLGSRTPLETMTAAPQPSPQVICGPGIAGDAVQIAKLDLGANPPPNRRVIEMTLRNVSGRDLSAVTWGITSDDGQANMGYVNISRCSSAIVSLSWPVKSGSHTFTGDVDPLNNLGESTSGFSNNHQTFVPSALSIPVRDTQVLDYEKARQVGARFEDNVTTPVGTCSRIGQENAQTSGNYGTGQPGAVFVANSPYLGSAFGVLVGTGCKADPEAFKDFRLKNGWKVKSVSLKFTTNRENQGDMHDSLEAAQSRDERRLQSQGYNVMTAPVIGSDDPHIQVHVYVKTASFLKVYAKITIEGVSGTDPYGGTANFCTSGFVPMMTDRGLGCARAEDVENCGGAPPPGPLTSCNRNRDCERGYICATSPCNHRCLRGNMP